MTYTNCDTKRTSQQVVLTEFVLCQYSETNVMHFLFSLLRIKGLYMFRALLAHPQEVVHKLHLVHCCAVYQVDLVYCLLRMSK
jgi:hypothetical protein